jgi:hypothetical protein
MSADRSDEPASPVAARTGAVAVLSLFSPWCSATRAW